jgi:hypothetical protein
MPVALRKTIDDATNNTTQEVTAHVWDVMRRKSRSELAAIREASNVLGRTMAAIRDATLAGKGAAASVLAGERAAIDLGAQDVRTLFSVDGGRTLRPFEAARDRRVDPLQVYVAVRKFNYWAEGFACVPDEPHPAVALGAVLLDNALAAIRPGMTVALLSRILGLAPPYRTHAVTQGALAVPIGLALDAPPSGSDAFEPGEVYSVRVGLTDGAELHAVVSAMIAIRDDGNEVLWRTSIA